jgi:serine protease Do
MASAALATETPPDGYGAMVAKLLPSVVSIYVRTAAQEAAGNGQGQARQYSKSTQGSGFIIDSSGYIITNHHVIENAYDITVVMEDGRYLKAALIGKLKRVDLALLKVESSRPLPAITFGDSGKMIPGDTVLAMGNPLGLGGTVTRGIVSALNRNISETPFDDFMQVDAAINHGNSGGPLFNTAGEVVGVNTAFFSPDGGSSGLGFAIPSNDVVWIIDQLRSRKGLRPGWVDLQVQSVSDEIAEAFDLTSPGGAIVVGVKPESIASKAGVHEGDIVLRFNNQPIQDVRSLAREVGKTEPGQTAPMQVWRDGQTATLSIPVVEWHGVGGINGIPPDTHDAAVAQGLKAPHLGLSLVPLSSDQRRIWGISVNQKGVMISSVTPFSIADNHELRPGEIIVKVFDTAVNMPDDVPRLIRASHDKKARYVAFLVANDNGTRWVPVPIAAGQP